MNPWLVLAAVVVIGGAVVAVSARDARVTIAGLTLVLVAAPIVGSPGPAILPVAGRVVAAVLATSLLWLTARRHDVEVEPSRIGWATEAAAATAAGLLGFAAAGPDGAAAGLGGPAETRAAAFALVAVAIRPVARATDALGLGIGLILLLVAASLLWSAFGGPLGAIDELAVAGLLVVVAGAVALVAVASRATSGGLDLAMAGPRPSRSGPGVASRRHHGPDEAGRTSRGQAHRMTPPMGVETLGYAEPGAATASETPELASIVRAAGGEPAAGPPDADAATQTQPATPEPERRPPPRP